MSGNPVLPVQQPSGRIEFSEAVWQDLEHTATTAYPFEACGLLGGSVTPTRRVTQIYPLENVRKRGGGGHYEFEFDAQQVYQATQMAFKAGLDIVGIFHSHPDHPARPSQTDVSQPMLAQWTNLIIAVQGGQVKETKAWMREDEHASFVEQPVKVLEPDQSPLPEIP